MSTEAAPRRIVQPPSDLEQLLDVSRFLSSHTEPAVLLGPDGQQTPLPIEVYEILVNAVDALQAGKAVTLSLVEPRLTTQQAADLLGVSRPTLIKFLDSGALPYERLPTSRHRRIGLNDLLKFDQEQRLRRREALDALTEEAVEQGLYEQSSSAYTEALRAARKKRESEGG